MSPEMSCISYAAQLFDPGACSAKPVHYLEDK
jgi:hypothetical protein